MRKLLFPFIVITGFCHTITAQDNQKSRESSYSASSEGAKKEKKSESAQMDTEPASVRSAKELKGDEYYFIYSYDKAIIEYESEANLTEQGQRRLAKCYYNMNQNSKAEEAYAKLANLYGKKNPEDLFYYAMILKVNGNYDGSNATMEEFKALKPGDLRGIDHTAHKSEILELLKDKSKYSVLPIDINSNAEDFGTSYYMDKVVFASSRSVKANPDKSERNGKAYLNLYVSEVKNGQMSAPESFDRKLDGKMNEGPASFSKDGKFMAFTKNNYELTKKELVVTLEIHFRSFAEGEWSEPLAFDLNSKDYSVQHPYLLADGKTMYFSSNMPGGLGGMDLYKVKMQNEVWGKAENLGNTINTEGDEVFPFFQEKEGILYFSSNGRFGLGGLDIFSIKTNGQVNGPATNLGYPVNTGSDDFSFVLDSTMTSGYFSSNRPNGKGGDDIFSVTPVKDRTIAGIAKDIADKPVAGALISLTDENNKVINSLTTLEDGTYTFTAAINTNYRLSGSKPAYEDASTTANTYGTELLVKADLVMLSPEKAAEPVKSTPVTKTPKTKAPKSENASFASIFFDYKQYTLRPEAKTELDRIITYLKANPTVKIQLESHTDCRASKEFNQKLSEKRAKVSADYIRKQISNPSRVSFKGGGELKPINACACEGTTVSECPEDSHQQNRRTDFIIVEK